jgi:hypothetical protein
MGWVQGVYLLNYPPPKNSWPCMGKSKQGLGRGVVFSSRGGGGGGGCMSCRSREVFSSSIGVMFSDKCLKPILVHVVRFKAWSEYFCFSMELVDDCLSFFKRLSLQPC